MKFSHQLKFNAVPEWKDFYISYSDLKKIIYALSKKELYEEAEQHAEDLGRPLLPATMPSPSRHREDVTEDSLQRKLDEELKKIISFYNKMEAELKSKLTELEVDVHQLEAVHRTPSGNTLETAQSMESGELQPATKDLSRSQRVDFWYKPPRSVARTVGKARDTLKARFIELFVALCDLKDYLKINYEGFRKVVKKHDKECSSNMRERWWHVMEVQYPSKGSEVLEGLIDKVVDNYSVVFTGDKVDSAKEFLAKHLREHVKMERGTIWKDMVALERRKAGVKVVEAAGLKRRGLAKLAAYSQWINLGLSCLVFMMLLSVDVFQEPEKQNCLALLTFVSLLWATEALPLFATSMLVPVLVVVLRVLTDRTTNPPTRLTPQQAAPAVFHSMFSQTIMLLLGGFAIAAALSKHFIAKQLAVAVLSRVGRKPRNVLLASMFVATFASMWISNVAAPVLCFSLVQPILRNLEVSNPFAKALVIGIALASNVGGMTSPISSPQNIFAIERMSLDGAPPSWLQWFAVALPVAILCNLACWGLLLLVYQPWRAVTEVRPIKPNKDPMNATQVYVVVVSVVTVGLWCANSSLQRYTGEMGIVAVLPLVAFFGFGVLSKDDFNGFLWNVVMLAMGGLALGEAVKSSGLLLSIATSIQEVVAGLDLFEVMAVFCLMVLVCTTFISHTVGAMVILPIVQSVGEQLPGGPHPKLLVMASALMCSGAMGLPVSGFPNMNAVSLENEVGETYVNVWDFIKTGIPGSAVAYFVIISIGYILMLLVGY